ncbi:MAG: CoA transferase [Chloroflexi bacterium]|nr:CoA transferase [Chloroflexota bacterium]
MGALDGVKVAEFAWGMAGPGSTRSLAAHGAEVIRVETGAFRFMGGLSEARGEGTSGNYPNKRCLSLNLKDPRGMEVARRLIAWADIMTESFSPGTIARMGLGYDEVRKIKPDIIMMSVSIQGQTGPYGRHPGFGVLASAITGLTHVTGWPDREPASPGAYSDSTTPRFGAAILLAALAWRRRTGRGLYIDLTQLESVLHLYAPPLLQYLVNGEETQRAGNAHPSAAPHGVYRCRGDERWCAITVFTDQQWAALCQTVGDPALREDSRFATLRGRKDHEAALNAAIERWTCTQTPEEVMAQLQAVGVPAGIVATVADIACDPQLQFRQNFVDLPLPDGGVSRFNRGESFILSETPVVMSRPSPTLGQDNEYVCTQILGYSAQEYRDLVATDVLA